MTTIQDGKTQLKELIRSSGLEMIEKEEEVSVKRVIGTISQRLEDAMNVLDAAEACSSEQANTARKKALKEAIPQFMLHPAVSLILVAAALVFGFFSVSLSAVSPQSGQPWTLQMILMLVLLLVQQICCLISRQRAKARPEQPPEPIPGINLLQARVAVTKLTGSLLTDSKAIAALFTAENEKADHSFEEDLIRIYCSLYEARMDHPEVGEFNYPITLSEMLLRRLGIREVLYSPETAGLFEIRNEEYQDMMRTPALIREETGELVRKGEYIRNISRRKA